MAYKWKPTAAQKKAFAEKMQDPAEQRAYEQRKQAKADKRRAGSRFDYNTAGGEYLPTRAQYDAAMKLAYSGTEEQTEAANMVATAYTCGMKVHHDHIHIVNEFIRTAGTPA